MEVIRLDGIKNIRDISYGNIKEKMLIRSCALNKLTNNDANILSYKYNVNTIIDLRTDSEAKKEDVIIPNSKYYHIPLISSSELGITHESGKRRLPNKIPNLCDTYYKLVTIDKKEAWSKIFDVFLNNKDGAVLWHCTVGKDRCGLVSAMIEYILGLDDETIISDYLLTNEYISFPKKYKMVLGMLNKENREKFKNIFIAKKEYLLSALKYIDEYYGSRDNFLKEVCNIDENKKEKIRRLYLK